MRVFDTSRLAGQNLIGNAVNTYAQTNRALAEADEIKNRKLLFQQSQEDRTRNLARQEFEQTRGDAEYDRQLAMSEQDRAYELDERKEADIDRDATRKRQAESHDFEMFKASEYRNSEPYRRKMEKFNAAQAQSNLDVASVRKQGAELDLKLKKEAVNRENIAREMQRMDGLMANDGKPADIQKSLAKLEKMTGMDLGNIEQDYMAFDQAEELLAGGAPLDDPKLLPALQKLHKMKSSVDGRDSELVGMVRRQTNPNEAPTYIPKFKMKDGSDGYQTFAGGSASEEIAEQFSRPEILEKLQSALTMQNQIKTIKDSYGLNPPPKEDKHISLNNNSRLVNERTGEVLTDSVGDASSSGLVVGGNATSADQANAQVMAETYETAGDTKSAMAHNVFAAEGIVSEAKVSEAVKLAEDLEIETPQAAQMLVQQQKNIEGIPKMIDDIKANTPGFSELPGAEAKVRKAIRAEYKRADGNQANAIAAAQREVDAIVEKMELNEDIDEEKKKIEKENKGKPWYKKTPLRAAQYRARQERKKTANGPSFLDRLRGN